MGADLDRYAIRARINTNDQPILALLHLDCDRPIGGRSAELLMDWDYVLADLIEQADQHEALHGTGIGAGQTEIIDDPAGEPASDEMRQALSDWWRDAKPGALDKLNDLNDEHWRKHLADGGT